MIYELHIGTFTDEGTLDSAIDRLDYLADLGVTHVELLPVNDFNGVWNWGYDGVLWYAVHEAYGGPDGLKRFVDACHARGLAVCLDVVYNHLGASGNYLPKFGPYLKTGKNTWGDLINLDGDDSGPVRDYIIDNACMWLSEFHVDALRLDAVHALEDESVPHLLTEMSARVDELSSASRPAIDADRRVGSQRPGHDHAGGRPVTACKRSGTTMCTTACTRCCRASVTATTSTSVLVSALAKALTHAFFHDGTYSTFRGKDHGKPVDPRSRAGLSVRRVPARPRPGRQPRGGRPAVGDHPARFAQGWRGRAADITLHADALDGRGVGGVDPVAVLHLAPRTRAR